MDALEIKFLFELDKLIAEEFMGWGNFEKYPDSPFWVGCQPTGAVTDDGVAIVEEMTAPVPAYTSDRWAAGELEEKLRSDGWLISTKLMPDGYPFLSNEGDVELRAKAVCELMDMTGQQLHRTAFAAHDSVCVAIALAALKAKGIWVNLALQPGEQPAVLTILEPFEQ